MLELKTAVATHRYVPRSFLHLTCALSMHGFTLLAFDNPSEVKPECDFATCRLAAQNPPSFVFCFMPQQTTSSLSSSKQRTPSAHTHHAHSRPIELTQLCSPLLSSSWSSASPLVSSRSLHKPHRFAHPHLLDSCELLLTDTT
jgi:hypothetical protein